MQRPLWIESRKERQGCLRGVTAALIILLVLLFAGWRLFGGRRADRTGRVDAVEPEPVTALPAAPVSPVSEAPPPTPVAPARPPATPRPKPKPADPPVAGEPAGQARRHLGRARTAWEQKDLTAARAYGFEAYRAAAASGETALRRETEDLLGKIHTEMVFGPAPMEEKTEHTILPRETLGGLAGRYGTTVELIARGNDIRDARRIRSGDRLRILQGEFTVGVSLKEYALTLWLNDRFFKRYPVGIGKHQKTPVGDFTITARLRHPAWTRPSDGRVIPYGHPEHEIGTHYLALDLRGYGIHGTWEPESIGADESAGCIRMHNEDVEELFALLPVGTRVRIEE